MKSKTDNFNSIMTLGLGGYKRPKILNADLEVLLKKQRHTPEGEKKLRSMWHGLLQAAFLNDEQRRYDAEERFKKLVYDVLNRPSVLYEMIKGDPWYGGKVMIPYGKSDE